VHDRIGDAYRGHGSVADGSLERHESSFEQLFDEHQVERAPFELLVEGRDAVELVAGRPHRGLELVAVVYRERELRQVGGDGLDEQRERQRQGIRDRSFGSSAKNRGVASGTASRCKRRDSSLS
jgi:hypothetical protein